MSPHCHSHIHVPHEIIYSTHTFLIHAPPLLIINRYKPTSRTSPWQRVTSRRLRQQRRDGARKLPILDDKRWAPLLLNPETIMHSPTCLSFVFYFWRRQDRFKGTRLKYSCKALVIAVEDFCAWNMKIIGGADDVFLLLLSQQPVFICTSFIITVFQIKCLV